MPTSNSNGSNRHPKRGRKPILTEAQRRCVSRLVRKAVRREFRRCVKGM